MAHPTPKPKRRKATTRLVTRTATFKAPEDLHYGRLTALLNRLLANGREAADPKLEGNETDADCRDIRWLPAIKLHAQGVPEAVVEVAGGVVTNVYATSKNLDVCVADHDLDDESDGLAMHMVKNLATYRPKLHHVY